MSPNFNFFILKRVNGAGQLVGPVSERVQRTKGKNTLRLCRGIGRHGGLGPGLCPGVLTPFIKSVRISAFAEAVILVFKIGGYLDRKNDPPPEYQILWHG